MAGGKTLASSPVFVAVSDGAAMAGIVGGAAAPDTAGATAADEDLTARLGPVARAAPEGGRAARAVALGRAEDLAGVGDAGAGRLAAGVGAAVGRTDGSE